MAKGDKGKHQAQIDKQGQIFQSGMDKLTPQLANTTGTFMNNYNTGVDKNMGSYDQIMNNYQDYYDNPRGRRGGGGGGTPGFTPTNYVAPKIDYQDPFESYGGYKDFASTGGFDEAGKANIRARAIAPTRAIYERGNENLSRQRSLQGGYSPGYASAMSRNNRQMNEAVSDANIAAESDLARMIQSGRLAGLGGMSGIEGQRLGAQFRKNEYNADSDKWATEGNAGENRYGAEYNYRNSMDQEGDRLGALTGMTSLYGTTPGMAKLFGDQVLQGQGQQMQGQEMQGNFGNSQIANQYQNFQMPSNFETAMNRVGTGLKYAGQVGAAIGTGGASLALPGGGIYGSGGFLAKNTPRVINGLGPTNANFGQYVPVGGYQ